MRTFSCIFFHLFGFHEIAYPRLEIEKKPLKVLRGGHQHWSDRVEYNPHHDQLVLSGGSDGVVNLWRAGSVSSAPMMDLDLDDNDQLDDEAADAPMAANGDDENAGVHGMDGDRNGDSDGSGRAAGGAMCDQRCRRARSCCPSSRRRGRTTTTCTSSCGRTTGVNRRRRRPGARGRSGFHHARSIRPGWSR